MSRPHDEGPAASWVHGRRLVIASALAPPSNSPPRPDPMWRLTVRVAAVAVLSVCVVGLRPDAKSVAAGTQYGEDLTAVSRYGGVGLKAPAERVLRGCTTAFRGGDLEVGVVRHEFVAACVISYARASN